jgi:two-component system sensor histidine kinase/response regulator
MDNPFDPDAMRTAGFAACLTKPVRHSTLFDTLATILSRKAPPAIAQPSAAAAGERGLRAHVLLAEDNEVNQEVAREILADAGCTVEVVGNGASALVAATDPAKRFDVILMDCQMPEMDGFEATRRIRAARGGAVPILALTANAVAGDRERCLEAGMNDYVSKPIDPDVLLATIGRLLTGTSAAVTAAAAPTTTAPAASPSAPIDAPALLNRCRGKAELAARLLNTFATSVEGQLAELRATLNGARWDVFTRVAHTIKGASANLSANPVSAAAAEVEKLGKVGDASGAEAALARLGAEVQECLAYIPRALPVPGAAGNGSTNDKAIEVGHH